MSSSPWTAPNADTRGVEEIIKCIIGTADGVFLWVVLAVNIVLDGLSCFEDLAIIRNRIMLLPPELEDLFAHVLTSRITEHHQGEASRYLLIALAWNQLDELRRNLEDTIVDMAQQASTYGKACSIAAYSEAQISTATVNFPSRLQHRCQGLLEHSSYPGNFGGQVTISHRTILDYLQTDAVKHMLLSKAGDGFNVQAPSWQVSLIESNSSGILSPKVVTRSFTNSSISTCRQRN